MKVLIDACVLYPTVMREVVLAVAAQGLFQPLWSARILEEWARAARKLGPVGEAQARGEVAVVRANWPRAEVPPSPGIEARLYLPDADDVHVLAAAIAGNADILLTLNAPDFPGHTLAEEGLTRRDPDGFLWQLWSEQPDPVADAVARVHAEAERLSGAPLGLRALLKKARLPRLGKALAAL
jgi:predicted nucleic acid-binding protein